jgi:hypothetical protein
MSKCGSYGIFDLMDHIGMPLRTILNFVIPSLARNLCCSCLKATFRDQDQPKAREASQKPALTNYQILTANYAPRSALNVATRLPV